VPSQPLEQSGGLRFLAAFLATAPSVTCKKTRFGGRFLAKLGFFDLFGVKSTCVSRQNSPRTLLLTWTEIH
jgi:predicted metal-binding membrane protein